MLEAQLFKIFFIVFILFVPLGIGYWLKRRSLLSNPESTSSSIIIFLTKLVTPFILLFSFWKLDLSHINIFTLPLIGVVISTMSLIPAIFFARFHKLNHKQKGSFLTSAMFSNVGYTLGGFVAFVLYGEVGFGLTVLYCLYFKPYFYTVGFYIAEKHSKEQKIKIKDSLKKIFTEGIRLFPLLGLACGIILNLLSVPRPDFINLLNNFLIPTSTFGYMFAIGMTLKFRAIKKFKAPVFSMSFIKFIWSPLIGLAFAYLFGYHSIMGGLPLKIVLIEASMPVAITSLIIPGLFNLDQDLSNSCWLFTTFLIIPLLLVLFWVLSLL